MDSGSLGSWAMGGDMFALADRWHATVVGIRALHRFVWVVRVLLALGFLPSGVIKVLGIPFTRMDPDSSPVAYFFDALHEAGLIYQFIGAAQLLAAVLLLIPRTATLGAVIYLPIILGIEVLTTTVPFPGTWVITSLMVLGTLFLLCWDWPRLAPIVRGDSAAGSRAVAGVVSGRSRA